MKKLLFASMLVFSPIIHAANVPEPLQQIRAVQQNDNRVITSGLPTPEQIKKLAESGVNVVINLMPNATNKEYNNEAQLVQQAGMEYIYIPVDWQNPTLENVNQFFDAMQTHQGKNILIHCLANYRASAFYHLYEVTQLGKNPLSSMQKTMQPWGDLNQSLKQYPQWQQLIEQVKQRYN
ncbi:protein tyrosine phosphatase family protein [Shewanella marina]|uniref:protein tyrosine phosphatase family protein n=1 Tax=Shewanella marina TaxID=487319 RepID=UPI00046EAC26|nr:protein tyrosine phosphatase family protein [Shewanella marina]